jgi:hypothetical protein
MRGGSYGYLERWTGRGGRPAVENGNGWHRRQGRAKPPSPPPDRPSPMPPMEPHSRRVEELPGNPDTQFSPPDPPCSTAGQQPSPAIAPPPANGSVTPKAGALGPILEWIPAEVVVAYGALLTLLVQKGSGSAGTVAIALTVAGFPLAAVFVVASAWANTKDRWWTSRVRVRAGLAAGGFVIWSLTVPSSGWTEIRWISENPAPTAALAGLAGVVYSLFATGADRRWGV